MKHPPTRSRRSGGTGSIAGWACWAAAVLLTVSCRPSLSGPAPAATADRPSVLIVVVDALRADGLGCYGNPLDSSPNIDRLAADPDAVLFSRHYVQGAWTKSSTASLFTGLYAFQHGVMEGHEPREGTPERFFTTQVLDGGFQTMAERFREVGFTTVAVTKSRHLLPEYGFAQGFDEYVSARDVGGDRARVDALLEVIAHADAPFFGYLHLAGCHHPYPPGDRDPSFMAAHGFAYDESARIAAGVDFTRADIKHEILDGRVRLEPDDVRFLRLIYGAATRKVDEKVVSRLIQGLRTLEVYDNTLLVLTADHGEELYDHQGYSHGHALWDEVIRVPLIVKFPRGVRPQTLPAQADFITRSVDLLPSLLGFFGEPAPAELPGENVFDGGGAGFAYAQKKGGWALVANGCKLIEDEATTRLFHLDDDPGELVDLAAREPDRVAAMRASAEALRRGVAVQPREAAWIETELDPQDVEALRRLGYLR